MRSLLPLHITHNGPWLSLRLSSLLMLGGILVAPSFVHAQESAQRGMEIYANKAGCAFCHGWAADGHGDEHSDGAAANLRETILDKAQILEVIKCGRPGTAMPHFDKFAYTDKRCYGATADDIGNDKPPIPNTPLQIFEVEAVAEYIATMVKDKGPPTKDMCQTYFKGSAAICEKYPAK